MKRLFEATTSCLKDQDVTIVPARQRESWNWAQSMLQWFIRFSEFLVHLGKTLMQWSQRQDLLCELHVTFLFTYIFVARMHVHVRQWLLKSLYPSDWNRSISAETNAFHFPPELCLISLQNVPAISCYLLLLLPPATGFCRCNHIMNRIHFPWYLLSSIILQWNALFLQIRTRWIRWN